MGKNRRNYYGECAAFIAAYGEVLASGEIRKLNSEHFMPTRLNTIEDGPLQIALGHMVGYNKL